VLRPTRRPSRPIATFFAIAFAVGLVWPAGISAAGSLARPGSTASAARADREPTVVGRGVHPYDAGRGHFPQKPLQELKIDRSTRGATASADGSNGGGLRTASAVPPAANFATTNSSEPAAVSFGPWAGLTQAATGTEPPDPWVAVGPDDVVQTVNKKLRFTTREGTSTTPDLGIFEFFDLANFEFGNAPVAIDGIGNPRWHYDVRHNRWLGVTLGWHCDRDGIGPADDSIGFLFGAISTTGDPTGDYYNFYVKYDYLPDFPMVGISADKFTLAANEYNLSTALDCTAGLDFSDFDAASLTTFDWAQMLTFPANPDITYDYFLPTHPDAFQYFSPRPAVAPLTQTNTIYGVMEKVISPTVSNVAYFRITGTNAAGGTSLTGPTDLTGAGVLPAFESPPAPVQPGGPMSSTVVDKRPTDAIWQDNVLTFASTYPCDLPGGIAEDRDCARVSQVNTATATPARVQDMLIGTEGKDTWYPGIGQSQSGTLHIVYTESSLTQAMSSRDRYHLPSDALNTVSLAASIANGGAVSYTGTRWGDYVGVAQDPRDRNAVWQGNEYTKSDGTWATTVSELQTPGSTFAAPANPVRLLDTRIDAGLSGKFSANIPRTVKITGRGGIPAGAVAITGNLTVVNQNYAGYASVTPTPNPNPTTASLNFPVGEVRGNNITSPLSSGGAVSIVYKAPAGKTTNFVLDVTGYFLNDVTGATYKNIEVSPGVPAISRVLDTRAGPTHVGLLGPLVANTHYQITVRGAGTPVVPAGAIAVTANVAVVGQTAGGYVTLSTANPVGTPPTATVNFPKGDIRANGVTIKLSPTGTVFAVFTAPSGSTHLVIDVTGYYVQGTSGARFVALTPGRRMDTRFAAPREGLTGTFTSSTPRTLIIEPYQGVPVNATAITGNLTVVGQTQAGYVSMTPTADSTPPNSTINFPHIDIRGNGVTGPLSAAGSVAFVYKAGSGAKTHLIFDLTGYFR
jgi:hypothetical protein